MKLLDAKKLKIGDIVILKDYTEEYEITDIDKSLTTKTKLYFWSFNKIFNHKQIENVINK